MATKSEFPTGLFAESCPGGPALDAFYHVSAGTHVQSVKTLNQNGKNFKISCFTQKCEVQGLHFTSGFPQNLKTEFHDWFAFFHDSHSHMVMTVSQPARQSQTRKLPQHENKQFHDFLGNFHIPRLFHDSNFFQDFPWLWEPCTFYCGTCCVKGEWYMPCCSTVHALS